MSEVILSECPSIAVCCTAENVTEYWCEGSTSTAMPTFTSDIVGKHHKGGIAFGAAHVLKRKEWETLKKMHWKATAGLQNAIGIK